MSAVTTQGYGVRGIFIAAATITILLANVKFLWNVNFRSALWVWWN